MVTHRIKKSMSEIVGVSLKVVQYKPSKSELIRSGYNFAKTRNFSQLKGSKENQKYKFTKIIGEWLADTGGQGQ